MKRGLCILVVMLASMYPARAARPLLTDDAGTVEQGKIDLEPAYDLVMSRPDGSSNAPSLTIKHGLTGRMDIGIAFSHETDKDGDGHTMTWGMSPLALMIKMALVKGQPVLPDVSFSAAAATGASEYGLNLIASKTVGRFGIHGNLGYEASGQQMVRGEVATGLAAEYSFAGRFRAVAEFNSEMTDDLKQVNGNSGLVGGSVSVGSSMFDLGVRLYDRRGPKTGLTAGYTIVF